MTSRRLRVLSLDGGGVRGLSALYILRRLLCLVNEELHGVVEHPIAPQEIFDIVVGTSTGGLIALLIVKLGMTVDECIEQYEMLSREIFGKPHAIGKRTGGFGTTKYSGKRMRDLVVDLITSKDRPVGYRMENTDSHPSMTCSVVCRELENNYTRQRRGDAFFLCSHPCRNKPSAAHVYEECEMADAARATSAAPTFFDPVRIMKKILVDGGYGQTNNPSEDAWRHYIMAKEIAHTDRVRWVNIGTGTLIGELPPAKRQWKDLLLPTYIQNIMHTIRDLGKIATDSERTGMSMHLISNMDRSKLDFHRLSATTGVHAIALDDYRSIDTRQLEQMTKDYLKEPEVEQHIRSLARSLAADHKEKSESNIPSLNMNTTQLAETAETSSIRQLLTGQQSEGLTLQSSDPSFVPSMAGPSEMTVEEISIVNQTPRSKNSELDPSIVIVSSVPTTEENTGVGDQFKTPDLTPHLRSSTAPA